MKAGYHHYVIHEDTGARMCQDGKWRDFASFGTYPECVKVWRHQGWALRRMDQLNWRTGERAGQNKASVLSLPPGQVMDASGKVFDADD